MQNIYYCYSVYIHVHKKVRIIYVILTWFSVMGSNTDIATYNKERLFHTGDVDKFGC